MWYAESLKMLQKIFEYTDLFKTTNEWIIIYCVLVVHLRQQVGENDENVKEIVLRNQLFSSIGLARKLIISY